MKFGPHELLSFLIQFHESRTPVIGAQNTFLIGVIQINRERIVDFGRSWSKSDHRFGELKEIADAEFVAFQTKARNHSDTGFGNDAFVTEFLPLVDIGDMNFQRWRGHTGNCIRNRN